jgi:bacteriocin biosynthesis cyclodehydratase domain-containing protein
MAETLRPGFLVSRRDGATVQVGLDRRAVLPDTSETRAVLSRLEDGFPTHDLPAAASVLEVLRSHDLVVDTRDLRRGARSVFAAYGSDAPRRLAARAEATVAVYAVGAEPGLVAWATEVAALVSACGITAGTDHDPAATVALLLCSGEPDREAVDPMIVTGQPHLLVVAHEGGARVGPFVVPGATACLRCVDAHLDEADGRRGVVLRQVAGTPTPVDPVTRAAAAALASRDVFAYIDGDRPATWSATTLLGPAPGLEHRAWLRHPHCGCCWGDLLDLTC